MAQKLHSTNLSLNLGFKQFKYFEKYGLMLFMMHFLVDILLGIVSLLYVSKPLASGLLALIWVGKAA